MKTKRIESEWLPTFLRTVVPPSSQNKRDIQAQKKVALIPGRRTRTGAIGRPIGYGSTTK